MRATLGAEMAEDRGRGVDGRTPAPRGADERSGPGNRADRLLAGDDVTRIATRFWSLRDALDGRNLGREYDEMVDALGLAVESLRVTYDDLARRATVAEATLERLETSESYRIGNFLVAFVKSPIRTGRRLVRLALTGGRRGGDTGGWHSDRRPQEDVDGGPTTVVCLVLGIPEPDAHRWLRVIAEAAIVGGTFVPVFVVEADLSATPSGFPVVPIVGAADWNSRGHATSWDAHIAQRVASVLRVYGPARLAGLPGALGPVAPGQVTDLLRLLTADTTLAAAFVRGNVMQRPVGTEGRSPAGR